LRGAQNVVLSNSGQKLFTTVAQKPNQGVTGNHGVIDCRGLFLGFFLGKQKSKSIIENV
jgi:hypothetical protein